MKKLLILPVFMALAVSSFGQVLPNRDIFLEGTAGNTEQRTFFMDNFRMEAGALGFNVTDRRADAGYTLKFHVQNHTDPYDPEIRYIILLTLLLNENDRELVSFGWPFAELEDMYEYNQFVFFRAAVLIPGINEEDLMLLLEENTREIIAREGTASDRGSTAAASVPVEAVNTGWQRKWLYLRASIDYPITFYILQGSSVLPLDNRFTAMPGATIGLEIHPLNFLSLELNFQASMGDKNDFSDMNLGAGAELKFPIKTKTFIVEPYGAFLYHLSNPDIYEEFPQFAVGGGFQLAVRGGNSGAFFIDIKYMFSIGEAKMGTPPLIDYNRHVIGLGIGYKFGFLNKK